MRLTSGNSEARVIEFFSRMYRGIDLGCLEVRCINPTNREVVSDWFPMDQGQTSFQASYEYMERQNARRFDVFFGVNPRVMGGRTDQDVLLGVSTWVDIDCLDSLEDAEKTLSKIGGPITPDAAVFSGAGLHVYHFLSEPSDPADDSWLFYRSALRSAARFYGGDMKSTNVSRVLRFPLSYSYKRGSQTKLWLKGEE